jgi:hypothetical protein
MSVDTKKDIHWDEVVKKEARGINDAVNSSTRRQ